MERLIERVLVATRWLLVPLFLGLALLLLLFIFQFFSDLWETAAEIVHAPRSHLLIASLGLVDLVMVAGLVVMVILGSYANYVSRLDAERIQVQLSWLAKLDSGSIKVKVMVVVVIISTIDLLQAFLEIEDVADDKLLWRVIMHLTFVVSAIGLAGMDRLTAKVHEG